MTRNHRKEFALKFDQVLPSQTFESRCDRHALVEVGYALCIVLSSMLMILKGHHVENKMYKWSICLEFSGLHFSLALGWLEAQSGSESEEACGKDGRLTVSTAVYIPAIHNIRLRTSETSAFVKRIVCPS